MNKPQKLKDLLETVNESLASGKHLYVGRAQLRLQQREVTRLEVKQVLKSGYHEKRKDEFKEDHNTCNYSIRGKTIDKKELRVAVTFDENSMLIITVIDLGK